MRMKYYPQWPSFWDVTTIRDWPGTEMKIFDFAENNAHVDTLLEITDISLDIWNYWFPI